MRITRTIERYDNDGRLAERVTETVEQEPLRLQPEIVLVLTPYTAPVYIPYSNPIITRGTDLHPQAQTVCLSQIQ